MNPSLPVIQTSIDRISYSSLMNWHKCPFYFKLVNIDKLESFDENIYTFNGTQIHKGCQNLVSTNITEEEVLKEFTSKINEYYQQHQNTPKWPENISVESVLKQGVNILTNIKNAFKSNVGDVEVLAIEEKIKMPALEKYTQIFKGSIDIVFKQISTGKIFIADFKSCGSIFWFLKKLDKFKEMQLVFYKHYYAIKNNIDLKNIETIFILLEKDEEKKNPIKFHRISSGDRKIANDLAFLDKGLNSINHGIFLKNRAACQGENGRDPCGFHKSAHCP